MHKQQITYFDGKRTMQGYLVYDPKWQEPRPGVLVSHAWGGRDQFVCDKAEAIAQLGYVAFALDMYGEAQLGHTVEEKKQLIQPFLDDRAMLRRRTHAGLKSLLAVPQVDTDRIAAIGFCFGGMGCLDLARSGTDIKGVVSFHGLLLCPEEYQAKAVKARILALHGHDDTMAPPEHVAAFQREFSKVQADWQIHIYSNTLHGFTNPAANDRALGILYEPMAAKRSWRAMTHFLEEIF